MLYMLSVLRVFAFFYLYFSIIMASEPKAKRMRSNNYRKEEELLLLEEISKF
jgi:hypothetical protein